MSLLPLLLGRQRRLPSWRGTASFHQTPALRRHALQVAWLGAWAILLGFRDYKEL